MSLIINLISSAIYDFLGMLYGKRKAKDFKEALELWMNEYIVLHECSIVDSDSFYRFFERHSIVNRILKFVDKPIQNNISDEEFIRCILSEYNNSVIDEKDQLRPSDYSIAFEFITGILERIKNMYESTMNLGDKVLLYSQQQGLVEIREKVDSLSEQLTKINSNNCCNEAFKEINPDAYQLRIQIFLEQHYKIFADKKEEKEFDNIIITIENIWTKSWKQKIEDTLFPYVENDRNIAKCYGNMMDNMTYDQIKKMIWRAYGEFHISGIIKAKIGEVLLNPYNKVLLVSGEHGSGKTHFLREYLQYQISSGCENYIIPIDADELCIELNRNDVDTVLLKFLRRIISDDISSWENISDFFNNRKAATITIVLDDINKLYRENTYAFSSFIASIEDYTRYDFIRWIIAISDYDAYMIESNAEGFINKYCMECESIYGKKEIQLIRGLNMSIYGKINYIGKKILALYGKELIIDPYLATKEKYIGGINIPLYAHFLALNTDQPEVHAYYSSYDNFANAIYATVKKRISSIAKQNNRPLHAIQEIALMAIADEDVFVTSTQISDIMDMDIFNILNQCKLLKYSGYSHDNVLSKDIDALDDSRDYYTELLFELVPDIFWAKKIMATELIKNKDDTRLNYTNLLRIERIQTTLMPCLIHYLNHNNLTEIFDTINGYMMNDGYYQYPLFCADQLSDEFREIIFRSMIQSKRKKLSDDETYALLIYLDRYIPTEQEIRESKIINNQFKLVHKYEAAIADYNQTEIFRVVLKRMLKDIDIHIFSEDILELFNGIQVKMNNVLGEECGAIYFYKLNEIEADIRNILPFLYTYLEKNISRFDPYCKQIKFPFHEMFTRSFLEKYFLSGDTFEQYILFKKQILELEDENKNDEVVLKLRDFFTRCLSCTIGNIFRMRWITFDSFTSIIDDLIGEVPDQFNYRIVIHLITNSIENSSTVSEKLDKRLIPYLKILISNDDFTSWVNHSKHKSIKKFIEYNVGNDERNSYELEKRK